MLTERRYLEHRVLKAGSGSVSFHSVGDSHLESLSRVATETGGTEQNSKARGCRCRCSSGHRDPNFEHTRVLGSRRKGVPGPGSNSTGKSRSSRPA